MDYGNSLRSTGILCSQF